MATASKTTKTNPTAAEALGLPVTIEFKGEAIDVLPSSEWPFESLEAFEEGRLASFVRGILAEGSYDKFKATKPTVGELPALVAAIQTATGIAGN